MVDPHRFFNYDIIREFYVNALPSYDEPFTFTTMVKEITIRFDRDNINEYLKNPLTLREGEMRAFTKYINHHWDINEISNSIYRKDKVKLNAFGLPVQYLREDMIPSGQIILILILYNIMLQSHLSSIPLETT